MAIAWFVAAYKRRAGVRIARYCAMDDYTVLIRGDGGMWSESEILGNRAIVKVKANSPSTFTTIASDPDIRRIPLDLLDDPLSSLTAGQRTAIRNEVLDCGYTVGEINAAVPDFSVVTLREVLQFMATRRLKPRYVSASDTIVVDGEVQACKSIDTLHAEVR